MTIIASRVADLKLEMSSNIVSTAAARSVTRRAVSALGVVGCQKGILPFSAAVGQAKHVQCAWALIMHFETKHL
jgi:hypothetical protein